MATKKKKRSTHGPKRDKLDLENVPKPAPVDVAPEAPRQPWEKAYTVALGDKICKIVRRGNFRDMAVAQVGISRQSMYNWIRWGGEGREPYAAFLAKLEEAESEAEDVLVVACRQAALKDWRAAAWLLERRGSKRWGYKAQVEFTVDEALEDILDVTASVLGGDAAAKLFAALASRAGGAEEARGHMGPPSRGGSAGGGAGQGKPGAGSTTH